MIIENLAQNSLFMLYGKKILITLAGLGISGFLIFITLACAAVITAGTYMKDDMDI